MKVADNKQFNPHIVFNSKTGNLKIFFLKPFLDIFSKNKVLHIFNILKS